MTSFAKAPAELQGPPVAEPAASPRPVDASAAPGSVAMRPASRTVAVALASLGGALVAAIAVAAFVGSYGGWYVDLAPVAAGEAAMAAAPLPKGAERGVYVVVDTWANKLRIYRDGALQREAVVSTGSGTILRDPRDGRQWVFDTPLGERRVLQKKRDPVWTKPDWAFVEEGKLPPKNFRERIDDVSLGDYSLDLGDGYLLHGTLFQTLLGQRLTHGCIRVGDADLEWVYKNVPVGARVYLF